MSLLPEKRQCSQCGKIYSWNPDVGKTKCPRCGGTSGILLPIDTYKKLRTWNK